MTAIAEVSANDAAALPLRRVFPPILLPIFLAVVDGTIVATALPAMAAAFGDVERVSWVIASYLVASTVAAPVYGRLGDAWGRRRLLLVALALFIAASVLCASARGILSLTAARVLQGFGGGGLMVLSQALLGENVPRHQLGRAQGVLSAVIVVSSTFGPVAGGVLTQLFGWPSVFLVNVPLGALAMVLALRLPSLAGSGEGGRFDWVGLLLFVGLVVPLLLSLEQIQHLDAAGLPGLLGGFGVSLACLVLLFQQERRAAQPLFPLKMLGHPAMWRANAMAACSGALLVSEATILPIHLQAVDGASAGRIGLLMLPLTATVGVGSFVTGRLISRTGRVAIYPAIGQMVAALGLVLVAFGARDAETVLGPWGLPGMLAIVALFQGTAMPVAQITAQSLAPLTMLGAAAASVQLSRSVGSAVGVTIATSVLFMMLALNASTATTFADAVHHGPAVLDGLPAGLRATVAARIDGGFTAAFLAIAVFAAVNAALALTSPLRRL
jgi:EmrB/QacA subfamily drug resistance transporter